MTNSFLYDIFGLWKKFDVGIFYGDGDDDDEITKTHRDNTT